MDTHEASEIIVKEVQQVSGAGETTGGGVQQDFCSIWPRAKPILELLAGLAILIPGAGATAGAVLKGLLRIGDKIAEETCS